MMTEVVLIPSQETAMLTESAALIVSSTVETDSSAYELGQLIGEILVALVAVAVVALLIRQIRD